MVQKFTLKARSEMYEDVNGDFVKYEDYEKLSKSVQACVAAIKEGSLAVEHVQGYLEGVQGYLEGVVEVLDGH